MATLFGTPGDDVLIGRGFQNTIIGFDGDDILIGGDNSDILNGREGDDILIGGEGADIFQIYFAEQPNNGDDDYVAKDHDTIADFDLDSGDVIDLPFQNNVASFERHNVSLDQVGDDAVISFTGQKAGGYHYATENTVTLTGIDINDLTVDHFFFS